jgi:fibro-slime domain-containing protein
MFHFFATVQLKDKLMILQKCFVIIALLCLFLGKSVSAQDYPDTLWIKVTFYDYHPDGSNPEFEPTSFRLGQYSGMVADSLSADKKLLLGETPFFNYNIDKWFRPWQEGNFTIPVYSNQTGNIRTTETVSYDTAFKNVVIVDSLPFIHKGNGMYSFERSGVNGTQDFFWLDGKGFGNEPEGYSHNFSFAMELHTTFTFKKGMSFDFIGDDDVWAFINGKRAMDLGGIHASQARSISLDSIAEQYKLTEGNKYPFDLFYVERHVSRSTIKVMTNLFTPEAKIRFYGNSGTPDVNGNTALTDRFTIPAGETVNVYARVFDSTAWRPEWDSLVTWEIKDANGVVISSGTSKNGEIPLLSEKAYTDLVLTVRFINPDDPTRKVNISTINLTTGPGKPFQVTFQKTIDTVLLESTPLSAISISEQESNAELYAVIRDRAGYFIRFADKAVWKSSNVAVGTVSPETGMNYKGIITKASRGTTQISANESGLKEAVIEVTIFTLQISLTSAVTADMDGNGYLDMITLHFDQSFSVSNQILKSILHVNNNGTKFTIDSIHPITNGNARTDYQLYIHEIATTDFQTSWTPSMSISQNADFVHVADFKCTDGAGPVIGRAKYIPGTYGFSSNPSGTPDTIYITISEKITHQSNSDPDKLFAYYRNGKTELDVFNSIVAFNDSTAKLVVTKGFPVESITDSIQLASSSGIVDLHSNEPNAKGRKAPVESQDLNIIVTPSSNPVIRGDVLPGKLIQFYNPVIRSQSNGSQSTEGVIIAITVKGRSLKEMPDDSYGKAVVYDAMGNLVRSDLKVTKVNVNEFGIYWDCRNKNRRFVGSGTYLAVFTISDTKGKWKKSELKIGVKEGNF